MSPGDPNLGKLQQWLLATITHPAGVAAGLESPEARRHLQIQPDALAAVIAPSAHQSAAERLAVYSNAYFARLLSVLCDLFPCTRYAAGEELFDQFAIGYLHKYPPASYTLARLADKLVDHLDETRPAEWGVFIVELARLEQAIDSIFDCSGPEQLAPFTMSPGADDGMRLPLVPGAELHAFSYPVSSFFTAWKAAEQPEWPQRQQQFVALFRRDYVVRRYPLTETQFELLLALSRGATLGEAVASAALACNLAVDDLAEQIGNWFAFWSAEGFFAGAALNSVSLISRG